MLGIMNFTPISTYYNAELLAAKYERKTTQEPLPEEIEEQPPSDDSENPDGPNEDKTMVDF